MFYEKRFSTDRPSKRRFLLSSFKGFDEKASPNTLPCDYCDEVYNFGFEKGELTTGFGYERLLLPDVSGNIATGIDPIPEGYEDGVLLSFTLSDENGIYYCLGLSSKDKLGYVFVIPGGKQWSEDISDRQFTSAVNYVHNGKYIAMLAGGGSGIYVMSEDKFEFVADALRVTDLCTHYERVYAVVDGVRPSVWFSDAFDPYNWNVSLEEGGYIETDGLAGNVLRVVSFNDNLYIFCEFGIYRLTAYSDQTEFSLKRVYSDTGMICKDSVSVCGSSVFFVSSSGIFSFDGYDVTRLTDRFDDVVKKAKKVKAVYFEDKYYVLMAQKFDDGRGDYVADGSEYNVLAIADLKNGVTEIYRGTRITDMLALKTPYVNKLVLKIKNGSYVCGAERDISFDGAIPLRYWRVNGIDFGDNSEIKTIVNVDSNADDPFILGIVADGRVREIACKKGSNVVPVGIAGRRFDFYIAVSGNTVRIGPIGVTVEFYERC